MKIHRELPISTAGQNDSLSLAKAKSIPVYVRPRYGLLFLLKKKNIK